jgi:predicted ATPase/class 3 adenylate cyclase
VSDVPGALPEGTLTLLFTDIEGSTRLLRALGPAYGEVLSTQRRILRSVFARWAGHEMGTEGDSFFVVFRTATSAVRAALDAQRELAAARWPGAAPVRVRMGMHTGEPTRHEDGYVGMDVHLAARVAASAHGGQVLLSEATRRLLGHRDLPGAELVDLGVYRLKDIPTPERLYQLAAEGLERDFPPVSGLGAGANLPTFRTSLVGRDREVAAVADAAASTRVLTLTGPGGVGKTRLAVAAAAALADHFPDGVYFVPLAAVRAAETMWTTIAEVLGATGENRTPPTFLTFLARRSLLLVLDNVEQLPRAAEVVDAVTAAAPNVHVLTTSRRPLHLQGEVEHAVAPLEVPPEGAGVAAAAASSAVELFVSRARMVRPAFRLTEENVDDVGAICARLDGLPLAIEIVAARSKLLGPRALRSRLDESIALAAADVDRPSRQRTLRAAIGWSYDLLTPALRSAFRQLSVFEGEVGLEAVGAVVVPDEGCGGAGDEGGARGPDGTDLEVLDLVEALVDANLLVARDGPDGEPRLRMLRTVAAFARDRLAAEGDADVVRRRHAEHYLAVAEELSPRLRSTQHLGARDRMEAELKNFRAALRWSLGAGEEGRPAHLAPALGLGLRLCQELGWFWYACGYHGEGRRWLRLAVEAGAGEESREFVSALHSLGVLVLAEGSAEQARDLLETCLAFWRREGDLRATAVELNSLALAHRSLGEPDRARALVTESVELARAAGDLGRLANALSTLAALEIDAGEYDAATVLLREVLAIDTEAGDAWGIAADHLNLGGVLLRAGRLDEAEAVLERHGADVAAMGDVELTIDVVELFAVLHARRGDDTRAAQLLGATRRMREEAELPMPEPDAAWLESVIAPVRERATDWAGQMRAGRRLGAEDAVRVALDRE